MLSSSQCASRSPESSQLRLAELMAAISLAIDLGVGQPMEWVLRCTLLGIRLSAERTEH